jgi:hypothetical protein
MAIDMSNPKTPEECTNAIKFHSESIVILKKEPEIVLGCPGFFCAFSKITKEHSQYKDVQAFMLAENEKKLAELKEKMKNFINKA